MGQFVASRTTIAVQSGCPRRFFRKFATRCDTLTSNCWDACWGGAQRLFGSWDRDTLNREGLESPMGPQGLSLFRPSSVRSSARPDRS